MNRRTWLKHAGAALLPLAGVSCAPSAPSTKAPFRRVRPSDPGWPSPARWDELNRHVDGALIKVESPLTPCAAVPHSAACGQLFQRLKNPYYIGDEVGLTQTLGWVDAWTSQPSTYAVAARKTADVVAAVNFARDHKLRLVIKGGGHSYFGTSNARDSLLIWTRRMNAITAHDAFVATGCEGREAPQPAVSVGAGAMWMPVYQAVTTRGGRYVQGGGCVTVGVAGLVQSGGFGSFSKRYGLAAAGLLEAEIVTADGEARTANRCRNPDLFWAIKGGGGGSFGVVTRLTLRTRELPQFFGVTSLTVKATSDAAYRQLIGEVVRFYSDALFNAHWGEQIVFTRDNSVIVRMVFQGLDQRQAGAVWRPFFDHVAASPTDFTVVSPGSVLAFPARRGWDPAFLRNFPVVIADDRPGAPEGNVFWAGDAAQVGQFMHAFQSAWMPAALLQKDRQHRLADAVFAATRHSGFSFHFNKGLAGAPGEEVAAARDTAMNASVLDAFALVICGAQEPPAYPGIAGHEPDVSTARRRAGAVARAMAELRTVIPKAAAYVSESDFFEERWQEAYWGANYARLAAVKDRYDPDGLFFVHHGVGSERWSADGFTRLA